MIVTNPFSPADTMREVSRRWWVLLLVGVLSVVAGGIILSIDWKQVGNLATFIGAVLVFRGLLTMFSVPLDDSERGWAIALGLLEFALGILVWVWPSPTLLVVAYAIGWYVLFSGIMTIAGSIAGRDVLPYWGFLLVLGIIEVGLAFWLLARPGLTLVVVVLALGLWCILYGVMLVVLSFDIKRLGDRADRVDLVGDDRSRERDLHHATP